MSEKWLIGDLIDNQYEIFAIKKGGMGIVFLCYDHANRNSVAIKTYQDRLLTDNRAVERFVQEASTWVLLGRHKNIVRAYRVETIMFRPYIILEHIAGDNNYGLDLSDWIAKVRLPFKTILEFAGQFCDGMIYAEDTFRSMGRAFIHRDIKPSNIMVTFDRTIKITDFGVSRSLSENDLCAGWGTADYMSPEQFLDLDTIDIRADIYSFGCVLYEMVCGRRPFIVDNASSPQEQRILYKKKHLEELAPDVALYREDCPTQLEALIVQCLAKNPAERIADFQTLRDQLAAIYAALTGKKLEFQPELERFLDKRELCEKGVSLDSLGRYQEAVACYDEALAMPGEAYINDSLYCFRGTALAQMKEWGSALQDYEKALEINPNLPWAYCLRANVFNNIGAWPDAFNNYNKALALDDQYTIGYYNRGLCYLRTENWEKALDDFNRAIDLGFKEAYTNRGTVYYKLGRNEAALTDFQIAIELNPRDGIAYSNMAAVYEDMGQVEEATRCYDQAMQLNPYYIIPFFRQAGLLAKFGRLKEAIECWEKALEINHADSCAVSGAPYALTEAELKTIYLIIFHDCGLSYMKTGNFTKAKEYFTRFLYEATPQYEKERELVKKVIDQLNGN